MDQSQVLSTLLFFLSVLALAAGALASLAVRRLSGRASIRPLRWGVASVVALNAAVVAFLVNRLSDLPADGTRDGVQRATVGMAQGELIGDAIWPGMLVLAAVWLYVRVRAGRKDAAASRAVGIGNRVATAIFWVVGGGFLLVLGLAAIAGR